MLKYSNIRTIFILILIAFIASGCSIDYDVNINENEIKEKTSLLATKEEMYRSYKILDSSIDKNLFAYREIYGGNCYLVNLSSEKCYNSQLINGNRYGVKYEHTFNYNDYQKSNMLIEHFEKYLFTANGNEYTINLTGFKDAFKEYEMIDEVNFKIITNQNVTKHNADKVKGNIYIWTINKDNYSTKKIDFVFNKSEEKNMIIDNIKILGYIVGGIIVGGIVLFVINKKRRGINNV